MRHATYYQHSESHGSAILLWLGGSSLVLALALLALLNAPLLYMAQSWAAVGMHAAVPPNEFNTLAQQLTEKEQELATRERMIAARESELQTPFVAQRDTRELAYMTAFGALLLGLVILNFVLDMRRARTSRLRTIVKI